MVNIGNNSYDNGNELKGKMDEHGDYPWFFWVADSLLGYYYKNYGDSCLTNQLRFAFDNVVFS